MRQLQLEVLINDVSTKLIGAFAQSPDGRMMSRRDELQELGIKTPWAGPANELVALDRLPGVRYRYDEPTQKIYFFLGNDQRTMKKFSLRGNTDAIPRAHADLGALLNYTLYAATTTSLDGSSLLFGGANATLDGRVFGPFGTFSQSAILGTTPVRGNQVLRLNSTWSNSNPETLMTYRAGDLISGGLPWTRPIRLGGAQMQRNFALRPDLVTIPLPEIGGTAAVPSTVDVYVNNVKVRTQDVPTGPFQLTNIPILTGASTARFVVRDASGRQVETTVPFFTSPSMLKPGLMDFSLEAGFPRLHFGALSNSYSENPVASASLRRGIFDWLTLEAHAEGGSGLLNAGGGVVAALGNAGVVSAAGGTSRFEGTSGFLSYLAFDTKIMAFNIHASSLRTFENYSDLASATARDAIDPTLFIQPTSFARFPANTRPPKALDSVSVGFPLPFDPSTLNFGYVHRTLVDGTRSNIINASYSRPLFAGATMFMTAFSDLSDRKNTGIFLGLSIPLGTPPPSDRTPTLTTSVSNTGSGTNITFDAIKPIKPEVGSYGWRLRDSEGATPYRLAAGSYRSSSGQYEANLVQIGRNVGATVQADGAIAAIGGGVFFSNHIDDAFAVVDAGAPNVDVTYENRPAGKTDANGRLLLPHLRAYERNKISIDTTDLPVDADAPRADALATPAGGSGIVVGFNVKVNVSAATVVFVGKDGKFIPPGTRGRLEGEKEEFVVGYDGQSYLKGLKVSNVVTFDLGESECRAAFTYAPTAGRRSVIGPVACK